LQNTGREGLVGDVVAITVIEPMTCVDQTELKPDRQAVDYIELGISGESEEHGHSGKQEGIEIKRSSTNQFRLSENGC
jgi:hypothetical protein